MSSINSFYINRRKFLQGAGASLAFSLLGPYALDITQRSKPWRTALIGTGWYGTSDLLRLIQIANVEVVGLCDVDQHQLDNAAKLVTERQNLTKAPPLYKDYKKLLEQQNPEIILIGTPDHWHALQAIDALNSGAQCLSPKTH